MLQVSDATKEAFKYYGSHKTLSITVTKTEGTSTLTNTFTNTDLVAQSVSLEEILEAGDNITFTGCNASIFKFSCAHFDEFELKGAKVSASITAENTEPVPLFTDGIIDSVTNSSNQQTTMDVVAYDALYKVNNTDYRAWYDSLDFTDMTLLQFRNAFFAFIGIQQVSISLPNDAISVYKTFEDDVLTGETILKAICQFNGRYGRMNREGKFDYVDIKADPLLPALNLYPDNELFPGYSANEEDIDSSSYNASSLKLENYRVEHIDCVQIADKQGHIIASEGESTPINTFTISNNPLTWGQTNSDLETLTQNIYEEISNYDYVPLSVEVVGLPYLECGDYISITAKKGTVYTYILHRTLRGIQALMDTYEAEGDKYQPIYEPNTEENIQKAIDEARQETERQLTNYDVAVREMNNIAIHAMGAYQEYEDVDTGGRYYYISNYPIEKRSDGLCYFNENAYVFRTSGQDLLVSDEIVSGRPINWKNGYDVQTGKLIVNMLYTIGLEADWIVTGLLKDESYDPENPYASNFWNLHDGTFSLRAGTKVGGQTVQQIANSSASAAETAARNYTDAVKRDLQDQIDDNITTWYYEGEPEISSTSDPYKQWLNPDTRKEHNGDLYYDKLTGYAYRFQVEESGSTTTYSWVQLSDSDIAAALAKAQDAEDLADNKRRVFITTPTPPYDEGDLWCVGSTGDILTCTTSKASGQSYAASDWEKLNKYTDDTAVDALDVALDQDEVFARLTNNQADQGIFLLNGNLYINASKIATGILDIGGTSTNNPTLRIKDSSGNVIGTWTRDGIEIKNSSGTVVFKVTPNGTVTVNGYATTSQLSDYATTAGLAAGTTIISGGCITTGQLSADRIHSGELKSNNYNTTGAIYPYLTFGTGLEMGSGNIRTPYFAAINISDSYGIPVGVYAQHIVIKENTVQPITGVSDGIDFDDYPSGFGNTGNTHLYSGQLRLQNSSDSDKYIELLTASASNPNITVYQDSNNFVQISPIGVDKYDGSWTSVRWYSSSDKRLKEKIKPLSIELSVELIDKTETKEFKFIHKDGKHYGMIAQDVRELLNDLGQEDAVLEHPMKEDDENSTRALDYEEYIPHLINYVKDLRAELDAVKAELAELKSLK